MGVIHGDLRQTLAAQMPRPAVAHMQHMRPAPATTNPVKVVAVCAIPSPRPIAASQRL
jgi:hypothetical protein